MHIDLYSHFSSLQVVCGYISKALCDREFVYVKIFCFFLVMFDKFVSGVTLSDVHNTLSTVVTYVMSVIACFF